ncbi:MAG TPA: site-2 protease family protein [Thermodesulfobacteriota bacterium]|jgi:membrane-associated protease RseP (regulator of RpoE activity)
MIKKVHVILFFVTLVTTFISGFFQGGSISSGISFSAALIFILGTHEMGHFLYGRKYGVNITPPYFIPAPPFISPIGTFGAFIKIKSPISTKRALFDIGIAGPLAGIIAAIPIIIVGIKLSTVVETTSKSLDHGLTLGSPLIFSLISDSIIGKIPEGYDLLLHPVAFAGWIGLFVTALNLIPAGQLDGGHIMYSIFSKKWHQRTSIIIILVLLLFGIGTKPIIQYFQSDLNATTLYNYKDIFDFEGWAGWLMWAVLLTFMGTKHPPTMYDDIQLDGKRKFFSLIALFIFIGCFTPMPIRI